MTLKQHVCHACRVPGARMYAMSPLIDMLDNQVDTNWSTFLGRHMTTCGAGSSALSLLVRRQWLPLCSVADVVPLVGVHPLGSPLSVTHVGASRAKPEAGTVLRRVLDLAAASSSRLGLRHLLAERIARSGHLAFWSRGLPRRPTASVNFHYEGP